MGTVEPVPHRNHVDGTPLILSRERRERSHSESSTSYGSLVVFPSPGEGPWYFVNGHVKLRLDHK